MKPALLLRRWWHAPFVRVAVWGMLGIGVIAGGVALAYEIALARVPQQRARLERLVRAHTGLDVRFNELNLRWGWYGPEAVFHRVELGEPGRSNVLVRAPQLIVGFDAWHSVSSGQLQAGRITFVAPDINLERRADEAPGSGAAREAVMENRARLLERWQGGRIEFEGGTLRLPDPSGAAEPLSLQLRRASVRRSDRQWSASALVFLPERLGYTARLAAQIEGDLRRPRELSGSVRFDGARLAFAGWRRVLGADSTLARRLPANGRGDVMFRVAFRNADIEKADGRIRAQDVTFAEAPWFAATTRSESVIDSALTLPRLRGDWRLAHRDAGWQLRIDELDLGAQDPEDLKPSVSLDVGTGRHYVRGEFGAAPMQSLLPMLAWLAPQIDLRGVELTGVVRDLKFGWSAARAEGTRLRATARAEQMAYTPAGKSFVLEGLKGSLAGSEKGIDIALDTRHGRLTFSDAQQRPLEELRIASELRLSREGEGWHLNTPLLTVDHEATQLILSGSVIKSAPLETPALDLRATLVRADVPLLRQLLEPAALEQFGAITTQLTQGRIERAQFQLQTRSNEAARDATRTAGFSGMLALRDATIAAGDLWPEVQGLDARIEWSGQRIEANVERAHAGSIDLETAQAQWSGAGASAPRISGRARGRLEDALPWLAAHPKLEEYVPRLRDFAASGDALFNFDVVLPASTPGAGAARKPAGRTPPPAARVRVAALLDGAELQLTRDLPSIESVRGSLAFDAGKLQRSTLTGQWLGGPVTLRVAERRERDGVGLTIQGQGLLDAQQLVALAGFEALPEVTGETPWSGELNYDPESKGRSAHWQLDADASLVGVSSHLPEPLAKAVVTAVPLRVAASGSGTGAQVDVTLGNRLRSQLALTRLSQDAPVTRSRWRIERGAISFGSGSISVPSEPLIAVHGEVDRFDFPAYAALWRRAGNFSNVPAIVADLIAQQLWLAGRSFPAVRIQARKTSGLPGELNLDSPELTGSVRWPAQRAEVRLSAQNLDAEERARIVTQLEDSWSDSVVTVN